MQLSDRGPVLPQTEGCPSLMEEPSPTPPHHDLNGSCSRPNGVETVSFPSNDGGLYSISRSIETSGSNASIPRSKSSNMQEIPVDERKRLKLPFLTSAKRWAKDKIAKLLALKRKKRKSKPVPTAQQELPNGNPSSSVLQRTSSIRRPIGTKENNSRPPEQEPGRPNPTNDNLRFILDIRLHTANGSYSRRRAKMDTGAVENFITHQALADVRIEVSEYTGGPFQPIGPVFRPDGEITLTWNVVDRDEKHETRFCVVPDSMAQNFDVLIGEKWIVKNEALHRNRDVVG